MIRTLSAGLLPFLSMTTLCVLPLAFPASAADEARFSKSAFEEAVDRGLAPNGSLWEQVYDKGFSVQSPADVRAFVRAIRRMHDVETLGEKEWEVLSALMSAAYYYVDDSDDPEDIRGRKLLAAEAGADLVKLNDKLGLMEASPDRDWCLLKTLRLLAWCDSREGKERTLKFAKANVGVDETVWYSIFDIYFEHDRDFCQLLLEELSDPLPSGYLAAAYLKMCNLLAMSQSDFVHPFNNEQGLQRMIELFSDRFQCYLYQIEACATDRIAPDIAEKFFNAMIEKSIEGYSPMAALKSAQRGLPSGLRSLQTLCSRLLHHRDAVEHLKTLGREDLVPAETMTPEFETRSAFSRYFSNNTLRYTPDGTVEIIARRQFRLPGTEVERTFFLVRYFAETDDPLSPVIYIGFDGESAHPCYHDPEMDEWSHDDAFARHFGEEIAIGFGDTTSSGSTTIPPEWKAGTLKFVHDWSELQPSEEVHYPAQEGREPWIRVAAAEMDGMRGFAVFDGPRSEWYDKTHFPEDFESEDVLHIHVGRVVLGLPHRITQSLNTRRTYPDEFVVETFEKWLGQIEAGEMQAVDRFLIERNYLSLHNPVAEHFDQYLEAVTRVRGGDRTSHLVTVYERLLKIALQLPKEDAKSAFFKDTPLFNNLELYISQIVTRNPEQARTLVRELEIYHDQNYCRLLFAKAALKVDLPELALNYFEKAMKEDPYMRPLEVAELWFRDGERDRAIEFLCDVIHQSGRDEIRSWEHFDKAREAVRILRKLEPGLTDHELRFEKDVPTYLLEE